ncbi:MFS transporter [Helicobacter cappadocius]|uniref:MFS transporter n=1 Tax=Helicobacter cappadocius TaxID=3063998 RepID=A0AA90PSC2_9HELI|nr:MULTISPECIES: MFS transporter [unclassified Helicobacter]MDO7252706.1 MFS transporter [Helicobacter sp. faydin-H75]MDP2538574.1 MFS transporter [Helicobacter sp. faydin-H76]
MNTRKKAIEDAKSIFRVCSGNFLEMYDFAVYGFYASFIAQVFFPSHSQFTSIMMSFMAFGVGFLMRPIGAIVLGSYMDRHGRKKGLLITLSLMALGTLSIAITPSYSQIGIFAPIIVVIGRLLQGFSAGAELGGVSVYLAEIAPSNKKGFYVSWQSASQQVATVVAGLFGVGLHYIFGDLVMSEWGWRIPFVFGCLVVPFLIIIRKTLQETPEFETRKSQGVSKIKEMIFDIFKNWKIMVLGSLFVMMTTVTFYFITSYTPTFASNILNLSRLDSFLITAIIGASNFFWLPVMGALSDKIGRKPILIVMTLLSFFTAYPVMYFLVHHISFVNLMIVELWLSFIYGSYNGAMVVALSEVMPSSVRVLGFSLTYSLAVAIFGGFTPVISTYFIELTNNKAMPGIWLSIAGLCSLFATTILFKKRKI